MPTSRTIRPRPQIPPRRLRDMMDRARVADIYELPRLLYNLLNSPQTDFQNLELKALWDKSRDEIHSEGTAQPGLLQRIDELISEIHLVDERVSKIRLKPSEQVCLLLGAGASAPAPSSIPTVAHLLPELWRRAGKIGRDDIDRLASWCKSNKVSNIEDLLTAAQLADFAAKNASVTGLLDYFLFRAGQDDDASESDEFRRARRVVPNVDTSSIALLQDTLQVLFGLLTGTMIPAPPNEGHQAVARFVQKHSRSSIVTTNYDGCADEALIRANVALNTYVDKSVATAADAIDLIKIHGSINWSYCDSCHQVREFPLLDLKQSYETDSASYAVIGICRNCGGQRRPLLIPPTGLKFVVLPNLIQLWNTARERLESANYIIVVGFSFSDADTYINKIIERSMTQKAAQKLVVCDPNAKLVPSLRTRFAARIDDFDESRILAVTGSADELLPGVLEGLVRPSGSGTSSKKAAGTHKKKPTSRRKTSSSKTRAARTRVTPD